MQTIQIDQYEVTVNNEGNLVIPWEDRDGEGLQFVLEPDGSARIMDRGHDPDDPEPSILWSAG